MRPAEPPGRLLERTGDRAPRGMIATVREHRTEPGLPAGSVASFIARCAMKLPTFATQTSGPGPLPPHPHSRPLARIAPRLRGLMLGTRKASKA